MLCEYGCGKEAEYPPRKGKPKWSCEETYHKYSIKEGFLNNVDPEIIASYYNLQILPAIDNIKKHTKCSITLNELKIRITNHG